MAVISIIVPFINERSEIERRVQCWQAWVSNPSVELLFVDGGSDDGGESLLSQYGFTVAVSGKGRACQMNAGARLAKGDIFWFIHLDTEILNMPLALAQIRAAKPDDEEHTCAVWGFSTVQLHYKDLLDFHLPKSKNLTAQPNRLLQFWQSCYYPVVFFCVQWFINRRSILTGISTGDQCQFFSRTAFDQIEGFPEQPLLEDVEIAIQARKTIGKPQVLPLYVKTSARRWVRRGIWTTILTMWRIRFQYWRGVCAAELAKSYGSVR